MRALALALPALDVIMAAAVIWLLVSVICAALVCGAAVALAFQLFNLPATLLRKGRG